MLTGFIVAFVGFRVGTRDLDVKNLITGYPTFESTFL